MPHLRLRCEKTALPVRHPRHRAGRDRVRGGEQLHRVYVDQLFQLFRRLTMRRQGGYAAWRIVAVVLVVVLVVWYAASLFSGEEGKIRKQIRAGIHAVEAEDTIGFLALFSQNYEDDYGITFPMIYKITTTAFARFEDIDVDVSNMKIEIDGDRAKVTLKLWGEATRAGTMGEGKIPIREAFEQTGAVIELEKSGGKWLFVKSNKISNISAKF